MVEFLSENWEWVLLGILVADKIVAATPCKWDDMILTSIKSVFRSVFPGRKLQ